MIRHFLSISDIGPDNVLRLVNRSLEIAKEQHNGTKYLAGKIVGIYFRRSSTRTRTAFTVGALKLGAQTVTYGPMDLQIVTGETIHDTAKVLGRYLNILVIRTNDSMAEMQTLADQEEMAVINAMSENEHPSQAIADLVTIREALGRLDGVHILYIGEGNNTTSALAFAIAQTPNMRLTVITPEGYGLPEKEVNKAINLAKQHGSVIEQHHAIQELPKNVDVVYTTRWETMGVSKTDPNWKIKFQPYRVTREMMAEVSKPKGTIFLHDLPAMRGNEVVDEVLDGPQSRALRQAQHKMNSAMAIMEWCVAAA
jgi:ornithine carbamoyltransferase